MRLNPHDTAWRGVRLTRADRYRRVTGASRVEVTRLSRRRQNSVNT